jgi:hypothetical protein
MVTEYRSIQSIRGRELFDGRLEQFGVYEHIAERRKDTARLIDCGSRCLTDGNNYLWVLIDTEGDVYGFIRYGLNAAGKILEAIARAFATDIVSEYEPQYWGFKTHEEWDAWRDKLAKEADEEFYAELLKYLHGEPNDIRPGTIGMTEAEIAKKLTEKDPALLLPENKDKLLIEVRSFYERDHTVRVKLSPQDIAFADMIAMHEDDLSRA